MEFRDILRSLDQLDEATKEVKGGRVHTAEPGGYGRQDDDDEDEDGKKIKKDKPAGEKRGRGRPPKEVSTRTSTGADAGNKKYSSDPLQKAMGIGKPSGKAKVTTKHKTSDKEPVGESMSLKGWFDKLDKELVNEAGLAVQPIPASPQQKQQQQMATKQAFLIKDPANPTASAITTSDPAVIAAAKNGTLSMQKPGAAPTTGAVPATGAGSQVAPMKEEGDKWIQGAVKHPGAFTKKAKSHGMTAKEFANKVLANKKDYPANTEKQAQLAKTLGKMHEAEAPQNFAQASPLSGGGRSDTAFESKGEYAMKNKQGVAEGSVEEGVIDKVRAMNYDRLAKRSDKKVQTAFDKTLDFDFADPERFPHEKEFSDQMDKMVQRTKKANQLRTEQGVAEGVNDDAMAGLQKTIDFAKQHGYKIYRSPTGRKIRFVNKTIDHEIRASVDNDGDSINVNYMDMTNGTSGNDDASYFDETFKRAYDETLSDYEYRMDDFEERTGMAEGSAQTVNLDNLDKLINRTDYNLARKGDPARYHDVEVDKRTKIIYWVTQETTTKQSQEFAIRLANILKNNGFNGWTVKVVRRDFYNGKRSPWKVAIVEQGMAEGIYVKEGMEHNLKAAYHEGKSHGLAKQAYNCRHDDMEESRMYHEGYKQGLDECYGQIPIRGLVGEMGPGSEVDDMASFGAHTPELDEVSRGEWIKQQARKPGDTFKAFGQTMHDSDVLDEFAFESLDSKLSAILEGEEVAEGMTVSISKGQQGAPDSVSVSAQDGEADQLLSIIKSAGLGLFGGEEKAGYGAPQGSTQAPGGIEVVDDHDGMMALMKKLTGQDIGAESSSDYEDEEGHSHEEGSCNDCGYMESQCKCDKEVVDEVESEDQMTDIMGEDNPPDSGADNTDADVAGNAATNRGLATADAGADEEEGQVYSSTTEGYYKDPDGDEDSAEDKADKADHEHRGREESDAEEDDKAEEAGEEVKKDIEYDDEKDKDKVDESYANSADDTFEADIDFMTNIISGGLNKRKQTGQTTIPVVASQLNRLVSKGVTDVNESRMITESVNDWKKLAGIQ